MHKTSDINLKNISKIEGHTHLDVKVKDGKVIESKLKISENKRFFTNAVVGKKYNLIPSIMARICGTCSSSHSLCSIESIEKALNVKITNQTFLLKNLLVNASHFRDHAMHIYFFCLPDLLGKDSVLDFKSPEEHQLVHDGLDVKEAGNYLTTIIGGRAVHPPNAVVGGFLKVPSEEQIKTAIKKLEAVRPKVLKIIDIFYKKDLTFERDCNHVALVTTDYNYLKGHIENSLGTVIPEKRYGEHLNRVVLPYSTATSFEWDFDEYMVGAVSRLNLNKKALHKKTKKDIKEPLKEFPSKNAFHNNLAQAIEMLQDLDHSLEILRNNKFKLEKPIIPKLPTIKPTIGTGVVEAPRGTLYYQLQINKSGTISHAELSIPTQQNMKNIENNIARYVETMLDLPKPKVSLNVERLIRAYDPCMSCATHFLKINWK